MNYDDFSVEEYVDVYGIPFEVIPVKKKPSGPPPPPKETTLVQALKEREARFKIEFPHVEGYVFEVRDRIRVDIDAIERLTVEPTKEPTEVISRAQVGYQTGTPSLAGPGEAVIQTRAEFYEGVRVQQIEYEIARRIASSLVSNYEAARRWTRAVTHWGEMGRWVFEPCKQPSQVKKILKQYAGD